MSAPRGPGRDLSALKKSSGLRTLRPNAALIEQEPVPADPSLGLADSEQHGKELAEVFPPQARRPPLKAARRDPAPVTAAAGGKRGTIAYLPAEVKERLEAAARAAAQTYTEWFLNQFDALYDQLAEEFPPPPQRRSPLPARARPPRRRVGLGPSTMLQLRLTSEELSAIDERRAQLSGPSRSEFVTRIIELGIERST
jgi:phytoene dehydrogenase-like protein